ERLALGRELLRLRIRQAPRIGEPPVDLDQPIDLRQVLRRADRHQGIVMPHRRLPDYLEFHAIGGVREELEILEYFRVTREFSSGADLEPEKLLRRGHLGLATGARAKVGLPAGVRT